MKQVVEDMKKNYENFQVGRIMIVDDEVELMTALCEALAGQGYETMGFTTGADALKVLVEHDYDLLLTDLMMPEMDGIALLQAGLEIDPNLVGIIMTGHGTVQTAVGAMKTGAFDYVLKPFKLNTLLPLLSRAMEVRSLRMENIQLRETVAIHELGKVIAFSSDLNAILNKVADATLQQCTADEVSIMLPTRDGKELYVAVARGGHREYIGEHVPMDRGIAGWVARNRETVIINGTVDDPRFSPVNPRTDIRAAVSMPMMAGGNLVGVLNVNVTRSHRHMTLGQVKALSILVSIISPILENTWLNIQIRQAEEKYRSIFENASDGIYQTTQEGHFIIANRALATMLGYDSPEELMSTVTDIANQLYVNQEERTKLKQMIEHHGQVRSFETRLYRKDGRIIWVSINIHAICDKKGELLNYDGIAEDISEKKREEQRQILINKILEALNCPNEIINLIRDILLLLKDYIGIEAIGLRLREGDDFPYYETNGFPPHFLEAENYLCARDDTGEIIRDSNGNPCLECMCGKIVCGRTDPTFPFFTEGGSFWTNSTTKLLASTLEEDRQARIRNRCTSEGYESVALIPLRSGDEIIGLLQLNNSRRDSFTIEMIKFLERIGAAIGIAVARKLAEEELEQTLEKLKKSLIGTIQAMSLMVETRDPYTAGHQRRVSNLARTIAQEMGLSNDTVDTIRIAGTIHDIGKISIPADILSKPGKLKDTELNLIKDHSQTGYDILKDVELPYPIAEVAYQHHERLDGSGYPQGLKGEQILLEARIISVADVVEAMSSHRPYRPGLGIDVALEEIEKNKGILYDEQVVDMCIKLFREKGFVLE